MILTGCSARNRSAKCGSLSSTCINSSGTSQGSAPPKADENAGRTVRASPAASTAGCAHPPAETCHLICRDDCHDRIGQPRTAVPALDPWFYTNPTFSQLGTSRECPQD